MLKYFSQWLQNMELSWYKTKKLNANISLHFWEGKAGIAINLETET